MEKKAKTWLKLWLVLGTISATLACGAFNPVIRELGLEGPPPSPAAMAYNSAQRNDTPMGYRKFILRYPKSIQAEQAKIRLAKLLIEAENKDGLLRYARDYPNHVDRVMGELHKLELVDKLKLRYYTDCKPPKKLVLGPDEAFYGYLYLKVFVGRRIEQLRQEYIYLIKVDEVEAPDFIKVELLPEYSFGLEEYLNALVNIRYKISVSPDAPPGVSAVRATFGCYKKFTEGDEMLKGGGGVSFTVEVNSNQFKNPGDLEMEFEAAQYFHQEQARLTGLLNKLVKPPSNSEFVDRYLYNYNVGEYKADLEKAEAYQLMASHRIERASLSPDIVLQAQAKQYLDILRQRKLSVQHLPSAKTEEE